MTIREKTEIINEVYIRVKAFSYTLPAPSHSRKDLRQCWKMDDVFCCLGFCAMTSKVNSPDRWIIQKGGPWTENQKASNLTPALSLLNWASPLILSGCPSTARRRALWFSSLTHCFFPLPGIRLYKMRAEVATLIENEREMNCLLYYIPRWGTEIQAE